MNGSCEQAFVGVTFCVEKSRFIAITGRPFLAINKEERHNSRNKKVST